MPCGDGSTSSKRRLSGSNGDINCMVSDEEKVPAYISVPSLRIDPICHNITFVQLAQIDFKGEFFGYID